MACGGSLQRRQTADDPGGPEATQSGRLGCYWHGYNLCTEKERILDYLSYSDYFRLLVHVTCCKETATLPLWIRLMNFSDIVKMTILVARPSGAPNLIAAWPPGVLKVFSVVHQSVEKAAKKTMETVRPDANGAAAQCQPCVLRSIDEGFDLEWNL